MTWIFSFVTSFLALGSHETLFDFALFFKKNENELKYSNSFHFKNFIVTH